MEGGRKVIVHYLVKMNRAFVCDLYQYEVKKESQRQSKGGGRGGGIVAKLHFAGSHLAPVATFLALRLLTTESLHQRLVSKDMTFHLPTHNLQFALLLL